MTQSKPSKTHTTRTLTLAAAALLTTALAGTALRAADPATQAAGTPATATAAGGEETVKTPSGLTIVKIARATGEPAAEAGDKIWVHYTGTFENGTKFDSSRDRGEPIDLTLGVGDVIKGWDEGIVGMKIGDKRKLIIPPTLGYGEKGSGGVIPPNATLHFEVELMGLLKQQQQQQ